MKAKYTIISKVICKLGCACEPFEAIIVASQFQIDSDNILQCTVLAYALSKTIDMNFLVLLHSVTEDNLY